LCHFAALFFADLNVLFENEIVTEPGGAAENDDREKENEKPLHGSDKTTSNLRGRGVISSRRLRPV
jgi:hypothetical protein